MKTGVMIYTDGSWTISWGIRQQSYHAGLTFGRLDRRLRVMGVLYEDPVCISRVYEGANAF